MLLHRERVVLWVARLLSTVLFVALLLRQQFGVHICTHPNMVGQGSNRGFR